jgi:hypothetical protein
MNGFRRCLELDRQCSSQHIGWQVTGTQPNPGITIHLTTEESAAVGALLAQDFGGFDKPGSLISNAPPSPQVEILGFVKLCVASAPKRAKIFTSVFTKQPVGGCPQSPEVITLGDSHDRIHFAPTTGVMDWQDSPRAGGDQGAQSVFSSMLSVSGEISMNTGFRAAMTKAFTVDTNVKDGTMILIPGLQFQQKSRHFQSVCARGGEQGFVDP